MSVIQRAATLEGFKIEVTIAMMVMTNFLSCCSTKLGCTVVHTCLQTFSISNKLLIAEQLLEMDSVDQLIELWVHGW